MMMKCQRMAGQKSGRPKEPTHYGAQDHVRGRDPLGKKDISKVFHKDKNPLKHNYRGGSPLHHENISVRSAIDSMKTKRKSKRVIQETLNGKNKKGEDKESFLDESQLIDNG